MSHRSSARWLAPVALVTCAVAVYVVVKPSSSDKGGSTTNTVLPAAAAKQATTGTTARKPQRKRHSYVVKPGDTFSSIALKTGVPLARIVALNPNVDSQSLQAGQRIKLAP
jgi:LysM repeat protein